MKKIYNGFVAVFLTPVVILASETLPATAKIQAYSDSLMRYEQQVREAMMTDMWSSGGSLLDYLTICKNVAETFRQLDRQLVTSDQLLSTITLRTEKRDELLILFRKAASFPTERRILFLEAESYKPLGLLSAGNMVARLRARVLLSDQKYYEEDDKSKASPLEIILNSVFPFTSTKLHDLSGPHYGIRPWELNARFEPIAFVRETHLTGVLFSLGTLYNFFPELQIEDKTIQMNETFSSRLLKRAGIKLGAGGRIKEKFEWMAGVGVQVRAISLWGLYSFENKNSMIAIGLSDLSWLQPLLPYLE